MARRRDGADRVTGPFGDTASDFVRRILYESPDHMAVLRAVHDLRLVDCWVAAGFVRSAVWDALHGYDTATPLNDIDVIHFDGSNTAAERDRLLEAELETRLPSLPWSVRN